MARTIENLIEFQKKEVALYSDLYSRGSKKAQYAQMVLDQLFQIKNDRELQLLNQPKETTND